MIIEFDPIKNERNIKERGLDYGEIRYQFSQSK